LVQERRLVPVPVLVPVQESAPAQVRERELAQAQARVRVRELALEPGLALEREPHKQPIEVNFPTPRQSKR